MNLKIFQQLTAELNLEAPPKPIVLPPHQYTQLKHLLGVPKSSKEVHRLLMGGIRIYPEMNWTLLVISIFIGFLVFVIGFGRAFIRKIVIEYVRDQNEKDNEDNEESEDSTTIRGGNEIRFVSRNDNWYAWRIL